MEMISANFKDGILSSRYSESRTRTTEEEHRENQVKIVSVGDKGYIVLGVVSVNTSFSTEELKSQWRLADTILRKDNDWYVCMEIIDAEFYDI